MLPARDSPSSPLVGPRSLSATPGHSSAGLLSLPHRQDSPFSWLIPGSMQTCLPTLSSRGNTWLIIPLLPAPSSSLSTAGLLERVDFSPVSRSGHHCSNFYPYTLVLPLLELHINGVLRNIFSFRFLLLHVMFWRFIYVVYVSGSFHFIAEWYSLMFFGVFQYRFLNILHLFQYYLPPFRVQGVFMLLFLNDLPQV